MKLKEVLGEAYKDGMTFDEIEKALSDVPGPVEYAAQKKATDNATHEAASYKRDLRARQTEDEKAKADRDEQMQKMQKELEALRRDKAVSGFKAKFLGLGFEEVLAEETAQAMAEGKTETVFTNLATFKSAMQKELKKQAVAASDVRPAAGGTPSKSVIDYSQAISQAAVDGNMADAACMARLAFEQQAASTNQH